MSKDNQKSFEYALECIVWYNGHGQWLSEICEELEKAKKEGGKYASYPCPIEPREWFTEKHTIWEMLVGVFGDWGTSIRGGWIDDLDGCIEFIKRITKDDDEEVEDNEQREAD